MSNIDCVIFDLDGTLIDGTEGILSSVKYLIKKHNLADISEEELLSFIGPPIQNSLKKVYNLTDEQAQIYANTFREKYKNEDVYKAKIYNNIDVLLKNLKSNGYKLGIATYKREDYARSLVTHLGFDIFMDLTCGADNENKLTKKDILQKCIFDLKSNPENTVFVGDSLSDGIAANELGCKFIAVTYGFGFKSLEETKKCSPILIADCVENISNFFVSKNNLTYNYLIERD